MIRDEIPIILEAWRYIINDKKMKVGSDIGML